VILPVSASDTVGDHRHALRYFELSKRCLVLIRDIAESAALCWDPATTDTLFQDLRAILGPTTLEDRFCSGNSADDEMSTLRSIYEGLAAIDESARKGGATPCH
jgi:hypothetical protein